MISESTRDKSCDLDDAQPQMAPIGELIPDDTCAKVRLTIRPGGVNGASRMDAGLLKESQPIDAPKLDCELTVVRGDSGNLNRGAEW